MPRKQYGLKFEEDDVVRWDEFAESQHLTRTTLIETAVERLISTAQVQAPAKDEAESQPTQKPPPPPKAGIRRAYVCPSPNCDPPRRVFVEADGVEPRCPEHGKMVRQENKPYMGQPTT